MPAEEPVFEPAHFRRLDESDDALFYSEARLVTHIDEGAIAALSAHYATILPSGAAVLDLMSSWVSHYPAAFRGARVAGLGMNAEELSKNPALTERVVQDLNREPWLPYEDAAFHAVTIAVSVQYLTRPLELLAEIARVLRPEGICAISFSNRCFPTKATALWSALNDAGHGRLVQAYFQEAGGFGPPELLRLPTAPRADPLFVVQARRAPPAP